MPCYDPGPTREELIDEEKRRNDQKYGFYKTDSELIAHLLNMCCEMSGVIFDGRIQHRLSEDTLEWCKRHRVRDAKLMLLQEEMAQLKELENQKNSELASLALKKESLEREIRELNV